MFKPCVLIPVFNHEHAMPVVVGRIVEQHIDCIMINDGSNVECSKVLRELANQYESVSLLEHEHNQGKGAAFKTGLREAAIRGYSHVVQIDADGQHKTADIPVFLNMAKQHPDAIINGTAVYDESVPKHRLYGRYLTHFWVWINTLSFSIKDSMCGFRVYPVRTTLAVINKKRVGDRMDFDTEILVRSYWQGIKVIDQPTKVEYPLDGVSHFKMLRDNIMITRMHARLFFSMLAELPRALINKCNKA